MRVHDQNNATLKDLTIPVRMYQPGYPLYASLLSRHHEYQNFRRFRQVRMRMLLAKQDVISKLEEELNVIDKEEEAELFLGSCRLDQNNRRKEVFAQLDKAFSEYDDCLQRTHWTMTMPGSVPRHVDSTENWLKMNGCIARREAQYLSAEPYDLLNVGSRKDKGMAKVGSIVERIAVFFSRCWRTIVTKSYDEQYGMVVLPNPIIRATARTLTAIIAIILLLAPIVALNAVQETLLRFVIIFVAASLFVTTITVASNATMAEIFAAGAAYSAVLVVFVSGNGIQPQRPAG